MFACLFVILVIATNLFLINFLEQYKIETAQLMMGLYCTAEWLMTCNPTSAAAVESAKRHSPSIDSRKPFKLKPMWTILKILRKSTSRNTFWYTYYQYSRRRKQMKDELLTLELSCLRILGRWIIRLLLHMVHRNLQHKCITR